MRQPIEESVSEPVVPRPVPTSSSLTDRLRDWVEWFGLARLITSALATLVVCVGGWWLIRTPPPPAESALPVASSEVAVGSATLPPPPTVVASTTVEAQDPSTVVVHVTGAVTAPGVFELPTGSRVADAIDRAGGPTPGADAGALNLAQSLVDGVRIYVPIVGEDVAIDISDPMAAGPLPDVDSVPVGPVDVNRADTPQLETLPGVGPATAAAIITERNRNGPFASFEDLERVPGIGPAKLGALEGLVTT